MNTEGLKLIVTIIYSFLVAFSTPSFYFILPILFVLFLEKKLFKKIIKKLFLLNFFIVFLVVFVHFQNEQEALYLFIRTNLIMLFNITLFFRSKGFDIVRGFDAIYLPKVFVTISYFTVVMIEFLYLEFKKILQTLNLRGFKSEVSIFSYKTFGNIFAMMFIKAIKKSEEIKDSFILRGFEGEIFLLNDKKTQKEIWVLFLVVILVLFLEGVLL